MSGEKQDDGYCAPIIGFSCDCDYLSRQRLTRREKKGGLGRGKRTCLIAAAFSLAALGSPSLLHSERDPAEWALKHLTNKNALVREEAARDLVELKDPRSVEPLIAALHDDDPEVQVSAATALGEIGDQRAVVPLIDLLQKATWDALLGAAAKALGNLGDPRAVEPLASALQRRSENGCMGVCYDFSDPRLDIVRALSQIKDPRVIDILVSTLSNKKDLVSQEAAKRLGQLGEPAIAPLLKAIRTAKRPDDSRLDDLASFSLATIGDPAAQPLIEALNDPNANTRDVAAWALGEMKCSRALRALIQTLTDPDRHVRISSAYALGQIGDSKAVDPLIAALRDPDFEVRSDVAFALGKIGDVGAIVPLAALLEDSNPNVRLNAVASLARIRDPRTVSPLEAAVKDANADVRSLAASELNSRGIVVEIARDGRFIAYNNGTVLDSKTNLMWAAKDNGADIDPTQAGAYCQEFRGGGYSDWRLPYPDELASLYDLGKDRTVRGYMGGQLTIHVATEFVQLTSSRELTGVRPEPGLIGVVGVPIFSFDSGEKTSTWGCGSSCGRVLPVRRASLASSSPPTK